MKNDTEMQCPVENLYHTTAKQLYNLALYAVGDTTLAEETAVSAFSDACGCIRDATDSVKFQRLCFRLLYRHCKKVRRYYKLPTGRFTDNSAENLKSASDHKHLSEMLICLDFDERFIVLLFCMQKYSVRQIAKITRLPCFLIEKRLVAAVGKTMQ
jgi:DNA-directed RNA polymerase specialized sigma24 family protein